MSLIEFSALAYGFTDERVVADAAGALHPGNIIGLVGPNGGGKTTLLRLLVGDLLPEEGRVQRARDTRIEYVSQTAGGADHDVLYDFVKSGRSELVELKHTVERVAAELADAPEDAELIRRLGEAEDRFNTLGGHRWDSEVERLLFGLSFSGREFRQTLGTLSGGQRQKACLARALLSNANCFIFDEPTNHLDLQAQAFFCDYLKAFARDRGILLVSHDRWLLDSLATHIWELDGGVLYRYPGNYTKYVPLREQRREQARAAWEKQQEQIARTEEYIRRNLAGQNTKQAQGRRTILARMERLGRPQDDPQMKFVLEPALRSGEQLLVVENLAFGYRAGEAGAPAPVPRAPETHVRAGPTGLSLNPPLTVARSRAGGEMVVESLGFTMYRGERLGIVGPNGCGKTTLLRLLARRLTADRGMVAWGTNVELGIFSQDSADLQPGRDLMAELRTVEPGITDSAARDYLGRFGFSGDNVYDDVATLSGGERSRLTLAKIIRRRPNVLLMDEPTNHLDIYAREALEQFLLNYAGSTIIVAHDRALLERVCDRLVVFERDEAGGNTATFFRGAYSDWLAFLERERAGAAAAAQAGTSRGARGGGAPDPGRPEELTPEDLDQLASAARTSVAGYCLKQRERAERQAGELEDRIAEAEDRCKDLGRLINEAGTAQNYSEIERLQAELDRERGLIDGAFAELEEVTARAECWGRHGALYNSSK